MNPLRCVATSLLVLTVMGLTGCAVMAPVQGKPEVTRLERTGLPEGTLVSTGPRRLLAHLESRIKVVAPHLTTVDGIQFRDTAFPRGDWQLGGLLEAENRIHLVQQLQVDYLVLIIPLEYTVDEESGFFIPFAVGAQSAQHRARLSATIVDLRTGNVLSRIDSTAAGKERVYSYVILFSGTMPHVVTPMLDALVKAIVETIDTAHAHAPARIAVLAAEVPDALK